ncbi:MarR family transcriptional regulator [Streptosporangium sp. NPDC023825]|uniref:MarR family winged helix-turn-helix transcriptional regulator n=1 Tax=Streptosporangium sp. NPDC023825 TaxID=3154909 RepID=UPI00343E98CB
MASNAPPPAAAAPMEPAAEPGPLSELLCFDLYAASRSVTAVYRPLLEPLGLTYPQYLVLVVLWRHDRRAVCDLVAELRLDYNTVSPLLKRLEARGLLRRQRRAEDERSVEVTLTAAGRALQTQAAHIPDVLDQALGLDGATLTRLQSLLRYIVTSTVGHTARNTPR